MASSNSIIIIKFDDESMRMLGEFVDAVKKLDAMAAGHGTNMVPRIPPQPPVQEYPRAVCVYCSMNPPEFNGACAACRASSGSPVR